MLVAPAAGFDLAKRLRSPGGAPLGEAFSFVSELYFRGKLTYARRFARPPQGIPGVLVISPGEGLRVADEPLTAQRMRAWAEVDIDAENERYLQPLQAHAAALSEAAPAPCRFVLLGSIATAKYVTPLLTHFGPRLVFPPAFVGRGDMSRGGLLLRSARAGEELPYTPVAGALRRGPRPPRLPPVRHARTDKS